MENWLKKIRSNLHRIKGLYRLNYGFCPICNSKTVFIAVNKWLRDNYCCVKCLSIPRQRAIVKVVNDLSVNDKFEVVHETSPSGPASSYFKKKFNDYSFSQYFLNTKHGEYHNGVRCENLEALTYNNETFDLFISQDVMEHVFEPDKAFREVARVLKPGGLYIFTVPYYPENKNTEFRAKIESGNITFLKEPSYHKNPVDINGSLVTVDYGIDFPELIYKWSGMITTVYKTIDRKYGLDGKFIEVFVCRANKD